MRNSIEAIEGRNNLLEVQAANKQAIIQEVDTLMVGSLPSCGADLFRRTFH